MNYSQNRFRLVQQESRLFSTMNTLLVVYECFARAFLHAPETWKRGDYSQLQSAIFPHLEVRLPLVGPVDGVKRNIEPPYIDISVGPLTLTAPPSDAPNVLGIVEKIFIPSFVIFYEDNVDWIRTNVSSDVYKWPSPWDFARVVRNAMSHGGKVNIDNPAAKPVSWEGLTYGHAQNKRQIIGTDISVADIVLLMIAMADQLDTLGCPL